MPEVPIGGPGEDDQIDGADTIAPDPNAPPPLAELCAGVHRKLEAFLNAEPKNERVRAVQEQSRKSLEVIGEALNMYRYAIQYSSKIHKNIR